MTEYLKSNTGCVWDVSSKRPLSGHLIKHQGKSLIPCSHMVTLTKAHNSEFLVEVRKKKTGKPSFKHTTIYQQTYPLVLI